MKKTTGFSLAVAATLLLGSTAMALPSVGAATIVGQGYGTADGGEFNITVRDIETATNYIGFCLEKDEFINYSTIYTIDSVADFAKAKVGYSRGAESNGKNNLDDGTKRVFWNYIQNSLTFGSSIGNENRKANAVQYTLWVNEDEMRYNELSEIYKKEYDVWFPVKSAIGYTIDGKEQALNLSESGVRRQSQIIGEAVPFPEPTTMLFFGTGLVGLAGIARRRKNI